MSVSLLIFPCTPSFFARKADVDHKKGLAELRPLLGTIRDQYTEMVEFKDKQSIVKVNCSPAR